MEDEPVHAHANYKKLCYTTFYGFAPTSTVPSKVVSHQPMQIFLLALV